jgi:hypothetical protein
MDGVSLSLRLIENHKGDRHVDALTSDYVPYNTAQAGRLCSPIPIHLSQLQVTSWFSLDSGNPKKSALGFSTHGKAVRRWWTLLEIWSCTGP